MQSSGLTFYFLGILGMVSNSDARRRLYLWSDRPPKVCIVLAWLGAYLPRKSRFLGNGSQVLPGSDALPYCDDGLFWKVGSVARYSIACLFESFGG